MTRQTIFIIFLLQIFSSFGNTEVDTFVDTLDKFDTYCLDQNGEVRDDVYIQDEFFSCRDSLEYLKIEFKNREELMSSNPDVYKQFQDCVEEKESPKVIPFLNDVQKVTDNVSCNENEKKEFEKDCGKAWECNKLRAIKDGASLLPRIVRNPLQKYVRNTVKEKNYDQECIADGKSNCIKDFVYAFAANLWSSASSVWNLVSKGTKSLFNISGWFDDQADKLHAGAVQSKKDIDDFWDDPGKWFSNLIDNIKKGVDDWVRSSVFCSKWEGKPQFSKCLQPLENYECIDCDDKINATCVAIGAISSEVGVAFLTAGVGTAASLTARAGAKTLAVVAAKVSSKVKTIAPSFNKSSKVKSTKITKAAVAIGAGINKATVVATKIYSITSEKALKIKNKIDHIAKAVNETKVVMVTKAVIEKGNIPGRLSEKIAEKGVLFGAKAVSKVSKGAVKADADKIVKIARKAKTSNNAQRILSDRTHEKSRFSGHNAKGTAVYKRGEKVSSTPSSSDGGHTSPDRGDAPGRNQREPREKISKSAENNGRNTHNSQQAESRELRKKQEETKKIAESKKQEETKRIAESKKKEEAKRIAENNRDEKNKTSGAAIATSLAANLVIKGAAVSSEQAEREAERIQQMANGKTERFEDNLSSAKEVLGVNKGSAFSKNALAQAAVIKNIYSDENKNQIVSELQKSNSNLSQTEAEGIFNMRQNDVKQAYNYIDKIQGSNKRTTSSSLLPSTKNELRNLGRKNAINELGKELSELSRKRQSIESGFSSAPSTIKGKESSSVVSSSTPRPESFSAKQSVSKKGPASSQAESYSVSSSSNQSASSPSTVTSSSITSENSYNSVDANASSKEASSDTGLPAIVDNELIEEAIEKSKESVDILEKDEKKSKRSNDLKNILDKVANNAPLVETNILFTRDLDNIKITSNKSKIHFQELIKKVKNSENIRKKYTYSLGSKKLELYQYEDDAFHLIINNSGDVELIDNEEGENLLNRSAFNIE